MDRYQIAQAMNELAHTHAPGQRGSVSTKINGHDVRIHVTDDWRMEWYVDGDLCERKSVLECIAAPKPEPEPKGDRDMLLPAIVEDLTAAWYDLTDFMDENSSNGWEKDFPDVYAARSRIAGVIGDIIRPKGSL